MSNVSLSISVPEELKTIIMQRTQSGYFGTPSEYLRHLVREDIRRDKAIQEMEDFIQRGIDSGTSTSTPKTLFEKARKQVESAS